MNYTESTILDLLALLGGGRGSPLNDVTPHLLGAIFWGCLTLYLTVTNRVSRSTSDPLIISSFFVLFLAEITQASFALIEAKYIELPPVLSTFGLPLQDVLCLSGMFMLTASFLQLGLRRRELTYRYLTVSLIVVAFIICYEQVSTWFALAGLYEASEQLSLSQRPFISHLPFLMLLAFAMYKVLGSMRKIRWAILVSISCFFAERFLAMLVDDRLVTMAAVLDPIRGNLQLWAIPLVAYVTLRLRHVEGKRLEYGLQASERLEALGQLSSGIAHDFNNHLQIILGYTELAKANDNINNKQRMPLNRIEEAAESAGALVNQLLTFSRGQPQRFQSVDINEIITRLTPMLSRLLGPDIKLMNNLDFNVRRINADINIIEQVIINLVVNAKDAITGSGTISIQSRALSRHDKNMHTGESGYERTQLLVVDTGAGMDEKTARRAFEPFFTTKPVGEGTGLGLSTVYSAIQKHNGTIYLKSELGRYTRVYIDFPVCRETDTNLAPSPVLIDTDNARGETILLAEDETAIRDLASTLLQSAGYSVLRARDGQHAINIMRTYKAQVDLCIFDVTMPVLNGYDTYDQIAVDHPDTPVLFITGNTSRVAHVRSHLPHLQKPFSKSSLFNKVRQIIDEAQVV